MRPFAISFAIATAITLAPASSAAPKRAALKINLALAACGFLALLGPLPAYMDLPGWNSSVVGGRTRNAIATTVTGVIAHELHGRGEINVNVGKSFWPDATITGSAKPGEITAGTTLQFTSAEFSGSETASGNLQGKVAKSEFNWNVEQTGPGEYKVERFGVKRDATLRLTLENGQVTGTYERPGIGQFDYAISGTYTETGAIDIVIDAPGFYNLNLTGKIGTPGEG